MKDLFDIFKSDRVRYKKDLQSITLSRARISKIEDLLSISYPFFRYLNKSEKIEFMLFYLEGLMCASGQYPNYVMTKDMAIEDIKSFESEIILNTKRE